MKASGNDINYISALEGPDLKKNMSWKTYILHNLISITFWVRIVCPRRVELFHIVTYFLNEQRRFGHTVCLFAGISDILRLSINENSNSTRSNQHLIGIFIVFQGWH